MADSSLTIGERRKLAEHEAVIEAGLHSFVDVGNSLMAIRDGRLYTDVHEAFESYCQIRWKFTRQRAHQLIESAKIIDTLSTIVDTQRPDNEGQARVLAMLESEQDQATVWTQAVATAPVGKNGERKVTAAHIKKVADELLNGWAEPRPPDGAKLDMLDRPLPASLIPAFSDRARLQEIETAINEAIQLLDEACKLPVGAHISFQATRSILNDGKRAIRHNKPYTTCPYCQAKEGGCQACNGSGWVPKHIYEAAPKEMQ